MTPQELKNSILQLAIQGKLVEQRPEEGTAEELYQQIQAEKQKLIREGKIKKEKPLPEITEDEKPFDIPESWKWVRIGNAFSTIMGQSPDGESVSEGIDGIEFHQGKIFFTSRIIDHSPQKTTMPTKIAPANSLLICVRAPVGKVNITDRELCIGRGLSAIIPYCGMTDVFLLYWFQTYENVFVKQSTGTTFKAISADIINNQLIPLPPLAEQKRIVAKIEEFLPLVDRYEKAWSRLEEFNKRFPNDMQKSILQMAIQGKLVEQRPEEGTGEKLYQQIQTEKQRLVKEGKLKKEKPLSEITEEEKPFDIPESWKWVRLGGIVLSVADGPHFSPKYQESGIPFISTRNIASGKLDFSSAKYIDRKLHEELCKRCKPKKWDILYSKGGTTGIAAVNDSDIEFNVWVHVAVLSLCSSIYPYYLAHALNSPHCYQLSQLYTHGTGNHDLGLTRMINITLPLPPLAEQKRIVSAIESLLPLCNKLK